MKMTAKQDNKPANQQIQSKEGSFLAKAIVIGFVGGVFWSLMGYVTYLFSFSEIHPNTILQPWAFGNWKDRWPGLIVSVLIIGIISIGVALLYYVFLKKFKSIWFGIVYGAVLWAFVFLLLNPLFPSMKTIGELTSNTIITTICLYILYGIFVGYSISFEAAELNSSSGHKSELVNE